MNEPVHKSPFKKCAMLGCKNAASHKVGFSFSSAEMPLCNPCYNKYEAWQYGKT